MPQQTRFNILKKHIVFMVMTLLTQLAAPTSVLTDEGGETLLEGRDMTVELYICALGLQGSVVRGAQFAWIPKSILAQCLGKSLKDCEKLDYLRRVVWPGEPGKGGPIGLRPSSGEMPSRVFTQWISAKDHWQESKHVLNAVEQLDFVKEILKNSEERKHEYHFPTLEDRLKVRAEIRWERWTNGEGLQRVFKLPPKQ